MEPQPLGPRSDSWVWLRSHFAIDSTACDLYFDSSALRAAVEQYVGFFYRLCMGPHRNPVLRIVLEIAEPELHHLPPATSTKETVCLLAYPNQQEWGTRWQAGNYTVVCNEETGLLYLAHLDDRLIHIVAPSLPVLLPAFMRLLRLVLMAPLSAAGYHVVHASAAVVRGRAVALVGHRGSGKTTALLDLVQALGARVLAIDRLLLRTGHNSVRSIGELGSLGLAVGTAKRFGLFLEHFRPSLLALEGTDLWAANSPGDKARIPPDQLAAQLPSASDGPYALGTIIFPSIEPRRPVRFEPLAPEEGLELLRPQLLSGPPSYNPDWLGFQTVAQQTAPAAARLLADPSWRQTIQYYRLGFGAESPTKEIPLLAEVLLGRAGPLRDARKDRHS